MQLPSAILSSFSVFFVSHHFVLLDMFWKSFEFKFSYSLLYLWSLFLHVCHVWIGRDQCDIIHGQRLDSSFVAPVLSFHFHVGFRAQSSFPTYPSGCVYRLVIEHFTFCYLVCSYGVLKLD